MRPYLLRKNELIYLEVFITNFQYDRPPTPHNAEIVYTGPQKRAGSPAMQHLSQFLGHTALDVANVAETVSF